MNDEAGTAPEVDFSVVVPVYNSEKTLEALVERIGKVFRNLGRSYEIVLTDDGSRDGSWRKIEDLHTRGEPIRAFRFMRNHGQHYALKCGLDHCAGKYAITMDDDLQNPPEEIPKLIEAIESDSEVDVVIGKYDKKRHAGWRNLGSWLHNRLRRLMFNVDPSLSMTGFRILDRAAVDEIRKVRHSRPRIGLIILSITSRVKNVMVHHEERAVGRSGYVLAKMVANTLDNIINYSSLPLRMISYVGMLSSVVSVLLGLLFLVKYLLGEINVSGFTTTVLLILFTSGMILFSFGLVGEYLKRIVSQQLMYTQYTVRSTLHPKGEAGSSKQPGGIEAR